MVRFSKKEWPEMAKSLGVDDPILRRQETAEKEEMKKMKEERIQFYPSDLEFALDVGTIADMHVETLENGIQVLRMTVLPKEKDEYKTVKLQKKQPAPKPKKQTGRLAQPVRSAQRKQFQIDPGIDDSGFASKLANHAKAFLHKPMKRPDQW
jgi:hypothetical protein